MTEPVAPTPAPAAPAKAKWSVKKAARYVYQWVLAHPHRVAAYASALYLALHRAGV